MENNNYRQSCILLREILERDALDFEKLENLGYAKAIQSEKSIIRKRMKTFTEICSE